MFVPSLPETLDFGGPVGQIFARQAQVRWTQAFDGSRVGTPGQWSVSLENPESVVTVPGGASERNPGGTPGTTNRSTQSLHANLIWTPVPNTDVGGRIHLRESPDRGRAVRAPRPAAGVGEVHVLAGHPGRAGINPPTAG